MIVVPGSAAPKTALDVCTEAARMINMLAEGETLPSETFARAESHLDDILSELNDVYGLGFEWNKDSVPVGAFLPLARAVAGSICTGYGLDQYATMYQAGINGVRRYAKTALRHDNTVTPAEFF